MFWRKQSSSSRHFLAASRKDSIVTGNEAHNDSPGSRTVARRQLAVKKCLPLSAVLSTGEGRSTILAASAVEIARMAQTNGNVLLVGSVPLHSAREVFKTCAAALGRHLLALPDGEVGPRKSWIQCQAMFVFDRHPALETVQRPKSPDGIPPTTETAGSSD
jgi:hypothetical protein